MKTFILITLFWSSTIFATDVSKEITQLKLLSQKQALLQKQIYGLEKKSKGKQLIGQEKRELHKEISKRNRDLSQTESYFRYISTGIQRQVDQKIKKKNLLEELEKIVNPLIDTLSRISEKPRKIEKLKNQIEDGQQKISELNEGIKRLKLINSKVRDENLKNKLKGLIKEYNQDLATNILNQKQIIIDLEKLVNSKESLLSIWSKTLFHFFKTKGINLLFAFLAFSLFWFLLVQIKNKILNLQFLQKQVHWAIRPLNVLYTTVIFIISLVMAILVLYARNDWFLVTLIIIFIIGFAWSIKQWIPQFISKGRLLLNLGPIRESELVRWKGVSYKIEKLSYFSTLVNPLINGGRLRISIEELSHLQSRPILSDEVWFPTTKGDWVTLDDGQYCEILMQTPEQIIVKNYKGVEILYSVADFLALHPVNYSSGFILELPFQFDISEKRRVSDDFFDLLAKNLSTSLKEYDTQNIEIKVGALKSGAIDLIAKVQCHQKQAANKIKIERDCYSALLTYMLEESIEFPKEQHRIELKKE